MGIRITNKMMVNNTLNNVNVNKTLLDKLSTQMATQQKISRASEDPVVAIRALRLKSSMSSLDQFTSKNIPDAESWLEFSETALGNIGKCAADMMTYCQQLSSGQYSLEEKKAILESMQHLREQIYAEGNADYCGRSLFTGYKTNMPLAFANADTNAAYRITEYFSGTDVEAFTYVSGSVPVNKNDILANTKTEYDQDAIVDNKLYRLRLSYADLKAITGQGLTHSSTGKGNTDISIAVNGSKNGFVKANIAVDPVTGTVTASVTGEDTTGDPYTTTVDPTTNTVSIEDASGAIVGTFDYAVDGSDITASQTIPVTSVSLNDKTTDEAYLDAGKLTGGITLIEETGELILGDGVYQSLMNSGDGAISFSYEKTGFNKGELRPEHYFDCTNLQNGYEYFNEDKAQDIDYVINFNQSLTVNTEAKNVFDHDIGRDMDDLISILNLAIEVEEKEKEVDKMLGDETFADQKEYLESMKEAITKEKTYIDNKLKTMSQNGITNFTEYNSSIKSAITEIGSKRQRLALTQERAADQMTNLETLAKNNIGVELSDIIIKQEAANLAYNAALTAASKVVSNSLLNFL